MESLDILSEGSCGNETGSPTRPEGGEGTEHGRLLQSEEASSQRPPTPPGGGHETEAHEPSLKTSKREIVRSSTKFRVEPWRLAEDPEAHKSKTCGGAEHCSACHLYEVLRLTQRESAQAANLITRYIWKREGETLDAFLIKHGRAPQKGKEFPYPKWKKSELYRLACDTFPGLAPINASSLLRTVEKRWKYLRWDALVRTSTRPAHFKSSYPFPIHNQAVRGFEKHTNTVRFMNVQLRSMDPSDERKRHRVNIPFIVRDSYQSKIIQHLADGSWKMGASSIQEDATRPGRWYLRISYKRLVEEVPAGARTAAINRGIKNFLVVRSWNGKVWELNGSDIASHLKQLQARRREYQNGYRSSSRKGKGRRRALAPMDKLVAKGERWRDSKCQTIAAEVTKWLVNQGVTTLYIEDFSGVRTYAADRLGKHVGQMVQEWPYFKLQTYLVSALERAGLSVIQITPHPVSQECPECGHTDPSNADLKSWKLTCGKCGFSDHLDVSACRNVLSRGERFGGEVLIGSESLKIEVAKRKGAASRKTSAKGAKSKRNKKTGRKPRR